MRILITGATSGIGRQLALDYAGLGYDVIAWGRNIDALKQLEGARIRTQSVDLLESDQVVDAVEAMAETGLPSLVIMAAGGCEYINDGKLDTALFMRMWQVNFQSQVDLLALLAPHLAEVTDAQVYIVGSSARLFPFPRAEAYGATKAALNYFARSLRVDWLKMDISVGLIEPGFVDTPLTRRNDFSMPLLMPVEEACRRIQRGIANRKPLITFPRRLIWFLRLLACLPESWQLVVQKRLIKV
ncbi:SDR family NAD(P)-dependent oxidoreductase [Corallincola luteus]|uniref:SDR family NAD(P)-dependent oxidoreductase n=1 Tax=Corallincola luteus TaxID=1775177 RepID=A0ABY2AIK0_9GAMM|nr:SDR family NAD(P)-dependent oxidoreductase [Corallincola luteus]TCI02524.1 SDR family NAD(P)-dependent oxidoreductase [Corallincola luteus]